MFFLSGLHRSEASSVLILEFYLLHAARSVVLAQTAFPHPFHFGCVPLSVMCIFLEP